MSLWHIMETKFTFIVVALQPAVTVVAFSFSATMP